MKRTTNVLCKSKYTYMYVYLWWYEHETLKPLHILLVSEIFIFYLGNIKQYNPKGFSMAQWNSLYTYKL